MKKRIAKCENCGKVLVPGKDAGNVNAYVKENPASCTMKG